MIKDKDFKKGLIFEVRPSRNQYKFVEKKYRKYLIEPYKIFKLSSSLEDFKKGGTMAAVNHYFIAQGYMIKEGSDESQIIESYELY